VTSQTTTPAQPLSAAESDPVNMGWMVGSPPPADKLVRFADMGHYRFPKTRWSFANFRNLVPSSNISRGSGAVLVLPSDARADIDGLTFQPTGRKGTMTWHQSLDANYTDAITVLHRGRIVYEQYRGVMNPQQLHMSMSVTKSFFGLLGAMLVHEGRLDPDALIPVYVPELADTAYGDATVRDVLDMRVGVKYSEDYANPAAEIWTHVIAGGIFPRPSNHAGPDNFYDFLRTLQKEGEHNQGFFYKTVNTDVLGWIIRRVTGQSVGEVLSERIWQKLGVEQDACMLIDSVGTDFAGGGFNPVLRDMARFGEMMRLDGQFNGQQIVPRAVVDDIRFNGSREAFARGGNFPALENWSYRNMWWVTNNEHGAFAARGVHGQAIYIDPTAEMVIARFGSHPYAGNPHFDPTSLPAFHTLAKHLMVSA
jgi:CubicO group peptidase (beta-lactamase class C family)